MRCRAVKSRNFCSGVFVIICSRKFPAIQYATKTIDQRNRQVEHLENENRAIQFQVGEVYIGVIILCRFVTSLR